MEHKRQIVSNHIPFLVFLSYFLLFLFFTKGVSFHFDYWSDMKDWNVYWHFIITCQSQWRRWGHIRVQKLFNMCSCIFKWQLSQRVPPQLWHTSKDDEVMEADVCVSILEHCSLFTCINKLIISHNLWSLEAMVGFSLFFAAHNVVMIFHNFDVFWCKCKYTE